MKNLWNWIESNRLTLGVVGPLVIATVAGVWGLFLYIDERSGGSERSEPASAVNRWTQAQALLFESFDLQYENPDLWPTGQGAIWLRELKNGAYCVTNQAGDGEVDYQYLEIDGMDNSELPAAVDIHANSLVGSQSHSSGGLLYRYDLDRQFYYAITLSPDGQLNVFKRNEFGYNTLYAGTAASSLKDGGNRLAVIGRGTELHIYINDALVRVVKDEELHNGSSGIIGIGIGSYCFDNYAIYEAMDSLP